MLVEPARALRLRSADEVSTLLTDLVGSDPARRRGVLHVTSVWEPPGREPAVLRIRRDTPRSNLDAFLLGAARAWADALVTTGRILREEPDLAHWPPGLREMWPALRAWRREAVGAPRPPRLLVLTRQGSLDAQHPALAFGLPVAVFGRGDIREALVHLREEYGAARIAVEAGPSSALDLYRDPPALDELWLSRLLEPELPAGLEAGAFVPEARLATLFPERSQPAAAREKSGRWGFQGLRRRHHRA